MNPAGREREAREQEATPCHPGESNGPQHHREDSRGGNGINKQVVSSNGCLYVWRASKEEDTGGGVCEKPDNKGARASLDSSPVRLYDSSRVCSLEENRTELEAKSGRNHEG
ncbi:unnamed protein product [Pylaiella littoralis]